MISEVKKVRAVCDVCGKQDDFDGALLLMRKGWDITATPEIRLAAEPGVILYRRISDSVVCADPKCKKTVIDRRVKEFKAGLEAKEDDNEFFTRPDPEPARVDGIPLTKV